MSGSVHLADNILKKLWDSYKKEHPKAERPPKSLVDKAREMGKQKAPSRTEEPPVRHPSPKKQEEEEKAKAPKKDNKAPAKKSPDAERAEKGRKLLDQAGAKNFDDLENKLHDMLGTLHGLSKDERKSPAGKHCAKKVHALSDVIKAANAHAKVIQEEVIYGGKDMSDPDVKAKLDEHEDEVLRTLQKYNDLGDSPSEGLSDKIKGIITQAKGIADRIWSAFSKKSKGTKKASEDVLLRQVVRLAYARPDLRPHLLPLVARHRSDD